MNTSLIKCKVCGGDIEVNKDMTIGTCLYCGSKVTLPKTYKINRKKVKVIFRGVLIFIVAILMVFLIKTTHDKELLETKLQQMASLYSGKWISSDKQCELILENDGTCILNGKPMFWTRDTLEKCYFNIYIEGNSKEDFIYQLTYVDGDLQISGHILNIPSGCYIPNEKASQNGAMIVLERY